MVTWNRVLEKLRVTHLVEKFSTLHEGLPRIIMLTRGRRSGPALREYNQVDNFRTSFFKTNFNQCIWVYKRVSESLSFSYYIHCGTATEK
jgi:hypothetical protein